MVNFRLSANPVLFGWTGLKLGGHVKIDGEEKNVAFAILIEDLPLNKIIGKILDREFNQGAWVKQLRACKFSLANKTLSNYQENSSHQKKLYILHFISKSPSGF